MNSLWDLADELALEARDLMRLGRYRGAVSRAYYAVYSTARVLLVEPGLIPPEFGTGLRRLAAQRADADYHGPPVEHDQAVETLAFMERFLAATRQVRNSSQS